VRAVFPCLECRMFLFVALGDIRRLRATGSGWLSPSRMDLLFLRDGGRQPTSFWSVLWKMVYRYFCGVEVIIERH